MEIETSLSFIAFTFLTEKGDDEVRGMEAERVDGEARRERELNW